jgi:hypothetical protein
MVGGKGRWARTRPARSGAPCVRAAGRARALHPPPAPLRAATRPDTGRPAAAAGSSWPAGIWVSTLATGDTRQTPQQLLKHAGAGARGLRGRCAREPSAWQLAATRPGRVCLERCALENLSCGPWLVTHHHHQGRKSRAAPPAALLAVFFVTAEHRCPRAPPAATAAATPAPPRAPPPRPLSRRPAPPPPPRPSAASRPNPGAPAPRPRPAMWWQSEGKGTHGQHVAQGATTARATAFPHVPSP